LGRDEWWAILGQMSGGGVGHTTAGPVGYGKQTKRGVARQASAAKVKRMN